MTNSNLVKLFIDFLQQVSVSLKHRQVRLHHLPIGETPLLETKWNKA